MPEYQHFIPQFILRKYSDYQEPKRENFPPGTSKGFDKARSNAKKKASFNIINLQDGFAKMKIETRKTKGVCGLNDMYGPEIEKKFGLLEAKASKIIRRIEVDFANGTKITRLSRPDKDTLRRFLSIMLYRSRKFYDRFEKTTEDYEEKDRSNFLDYMKGRGFTTPRDVWVDNLRVFLDVPLGHDSIRWEAELMKTTYPGDAKWLIHHMNHFFLCFCSPEDPRDEFLLTQNAYGIFEGPNSYFGWTDWHNFAPISPKLLIALRSNFVQPLPGNPEFDGLRQFIENFVAVNCSIHPDPISARSWLADLPVERPRTSYPNTQYVGNASGRAQLDQQVLSENDIFDFKLHTLPSTYVQRINSIFLENAPSRLAIAFQARTALCRALESYLELDMQGFKIFHTMNKGDFRDLGWNDAFHSNYDYKKYLIGLERVAHSLGSEVKAKYPVYEPNIITLVPEFAAKFGKRYNKLGWDGLPATWLKDLEQAYLLIILHSYTERLIRSRGRRIKDQVRENRRNIVDSLYPRRIWLYLRVQGAVKRLPQEKIATREELLQEIIGDSYYGPEDTIVDASAIFRFSSLSKLMMTARDMNGYLEGKKEDGQVAPFWFHMWLAYGQIGSIFRCGAGLLEDAAAVAYGSIVTDPKKQEPILRQAARLSISRDQMLELLVRSCLEEEFEQVVGNALPADVSSKLKGLLMEVVYPTKMSRAQLSAERV